MKLELIARTKYVLWRFYNTFIGYASATVLFCASQSNYAKCICNFYLVE